jgi:hypothetical protein
MGLRRAVWSLGLAAGCASPSASTRGTTVEPVAKPSAQASRPAAEPATGLTVPGTYTTGRRCPASTDVELALSLYPDSMFVLRQVHRDLGCEEQISILYLGRWSLSPDLRILTLIGEIAPPRRFAVVDSRTLRAVDDSESPRASVPRAGPVARLVPFCEPLRLRGLSSGICLSGS